MRTVSYGIYFVGIDHEGAPLVDGLVTDPQSLSDEKKRRVNSFDDAHFDEIMAVWHERMMNYVRYAYVLRFQYSLGYDNVGVDGLTHVVCCLCSRHTSPRRASMPCETSHDVTIIGDSSVSRASMGKPSVRRPCRIEPTQSKSWERRSTTFHDRRVRLNDVF